MRRWKGIRKGKVRGCETGGGGVVMGWEGGCGWGLEWRYMGRHTVRRK